MFTSASVKFSTFYEQFKKLNGGINSAWDWDIWHMSQPVINKHTHCSTVVTLLAYWVGMVSTTPWGRFCLLNTCRFQKESMCCSFIYLERETYATFCHCLLKNETNSLCARLCVSVYVCVCVCLRVHTRADACVCAHVCVRMCVCVRVRTHVCVCIYKILLPKIFFLEAR